MFITLQASHVVTPKWMPDDGVLQTRQAVDLIRLVEGIFCDLTGNWKHK